MDSSNFTTESCLDESLFKDILILLRTDNFYEIWYKRMSKENIERFCDEHGLCRYFGDFENADLENYHNVMIETCRFISENFPIMNDYLTNGKSIYEYLTHMNIHFKYYQVSKNMFKVFTITGDIIRHNYNNITKLYFNKGGFNSISNDIKNIYPLTNITSLSICSSNINEIDISSFKLLCTLNLSGNNLVKLDLSKNTLLTILNASENKLTEINFGQTTNLRVIRLSRNKLTEVDLGNNKDLRLLEISKNSLALLSVGYYTNLEELDISFNIIPWIDLDKLIKLDKLNISYTHIKELWLCKNTKLRYRYLNVESRYLEYVHVASDCIFGCVKSGNVKIIKHDI